MDDIRILKTLYVLALVLIMIFSTYMADFFSRTQWAIRQFGYYRSETSIILNAVLCWALFIWYGSSLYYLHLGPDYVANSFFSWALFIFWAFLAYSDSESYQE